MKANKDFFIQLRKEIEAQAVADSEEIGVGTHAKEADTVSESTEETIRRLEEENRRLKEEVQGLREEIENYNSIPDEAEPWVMTEADMSFMEEENLRKEAALQQVEELMTQIKSLQEELRRRDDGVQRLPLADFIEYAEENFTPEQNERAIILKEVLYDVFSIFTEDEKKRLRKLGRKPQGTNFTVNGPLNDIHDNEHVKAGI